MAHRPSQRGGWRTWELLVPSLPPKRNLSQAASAVGIVLAFYQTHRPQEMQRVILLFRLSGAGKLDGAVSSA